MWFLNSFKPDSTYPITTNTVQNGVQKNATCYKLNGNILSLDLRTTFISTVNSPVVPAGVMDLKWVTMSILFSFLAVTARQRIHSLVSGVGSTSAAGFNCRFSTLSSIWATTSAASHDWDRMAFRTPSGRTSDCSLVWKKEKKIED